MRPSALVVLAALVGAPVAQAPSAPARTLVFEPSAAAGSWFARAGGVGYLFEGARTTAVTEDGEVSFGLERAGERPLAAARRAGSVSHYFLGNDPAQWRTFVPHYRELRVHHALPGVDLVHRAAGADLEFDLELAPGIDPAGIVFTIDGGREPRLTADGALAVTVGARELRLQAPVVYQDDNGRRRAVECRYALDGRRLRFCVGDHDTALPLVIDPVVTFSTMLGGSLGQEIVKGVHLSAQHELLVTGQTQATNFPLLNNLPYNYRFNIGYVTKFDAAGQLVFSTFFGGTNGNLEPIDVGTDPNGQIVVGGNTSTTDLPTTGGVVQPVAMGSDWFFVDFLASGTIAWCTYYGGPGNQQNMRCMRVLDVALGSVVAAGIESGFPFMTNAYSQTGTLVVAGIYAGNTLWCSTACGFSGTPNGIDITAQGHICLTGSVIGSGSGLPTTGASFQSTAPAPSSLNGFVFVFTGQQNSLVYATYLGGSASDVPRGIAASTMPGSVVVTITGETTSTDFPVHNAVQPTAPGPAQNGFVAQLDGLTQTLNFSTYLGGTDPGESFSRVGRDQNGFVVVAGSGNSANLPFENPLKFPYPFSNRDVVLYRFTPTGALDFCTNYGSNGSELLTALSVAANGDFAIGGQVSTVNWPSTVNGLVPAFVDQDAFVATFDPRSIASYGAGTPGSGGIVPVLAGGGSTAGGTSTFLQVHDGLGAALGVLGTGLVRTNLPAFGGAILTNALALQVLVLNGPASGLVSATRGAGWVHTSFPIPNQPWVSGLTIDFQAAFLDPLANGGVSLTNGVELVIQ